MYEKKIGKYSYDNNYIGKGSFSKVYIGIDENNNKYAIKKIYKKNDPKYINLVEKEIEVMEKLNHKNVVKLYDKIYTNKHIFLIMELCDNDLNNYIKNNTLSVDIIKDIMKQLIEVLKYIMDNNIVHRDLKPHNILINKDYTLKLADFGFAKEFKETLLTDTVCGSPLYMAPEILNQHKYNIKSDLWSVGVILYEMVMKEHPFKALNITELTNVINKKKPLLLNVDIHPECKNLIERLLIVDSHNRLDWDELYKNDWIYNNNNNNNTISEMCEKEKLHKEIKTLVKKEDSFDYCFENSVTDINLFENNTVFDDELNHELKKKENNKLNIENINLKDIIIDNYIRI
tara:strand:+ start:352 stop:1386 length:1035 start_codon:yes stop_codon:yes gene_type:complete